MTDDFKKADDLIARLHKYCFFQQVRTGENCGVEEYDFEFLHDFINRQKAEIDCLRKELEKLHSHKDFLRAEVERLQKENEFHRKTITENAQRALEVLVDEIDKAKSEAIKEFAERLKDVFIAIDGIFECWEVEEHIDNLVKEMVGDIEDSSVGEKI